MNQKQIFAISFFSIFIYILYKLYTIFSPFFSPIAWATILVLIFYPLYIRILDLLKGRRTLASLIITALVSITVISPILFFSGILAKEVVDVYHKVANWVQAGELESFIVQFKAFPFSKYLEKINPGLDPSEVNIQALILKGLSLLSNSVVTNVTGVAKNLLFFIANFLLMIFTLFFFFRDGEKLYQRILEILPIAQDHKDAAFLRLYETISAVVRGVIATAVIQGFLAGLGFWVLGVPFAVFLGFVTTFFSFLPFGGASLVWIPVTIYLIVGHHLIKALLLLGWGTLVVSLVDNFLKPLIISGRTRIPTLFLFFGILGGIKVYGFLGIILGPVFLAIFIAFVNIYREEYQEASENKLT